MKLKNSLRAKAVVLLILFFLFNLAAAAQKKPLAVNLNSNEDDRGLCQERTLSNSEFCYLFGVYNANEYGNDAGKAIARSARNKMIYLVQGQIDSFYKFRKDGRSSKIRVFQTILDFLRIGGDLAVTIMNGERAKSIIGATLAGVETGSTKFNKNFQVLQTQVLINKMNAKRAKILTRILVQMDKPVNSLLREDEYQWYQAKNDLRDYLLAGTFDDALDTLVEESSADVTQAEAVLDIVSKRNVSDARVSNENLRDLNAALNAPATEAEATRRLRGVVTQLMGDPVIAPRLTAAGITAASTGRSIWDALFTIRGDLVLIGRTDLSIKINQAIEQASR